MVDLLVNLLAMLGDNVLALLNVGGVNNHIIFLMADLSLVLDWLLVALLVWLAEALEVVVRFVTITWLSLSLGITSMMASMDDLRVMTNNSRAVVDLLVSLTAVLGDNVNTFLNVGGVHNYIILLMADLFMIGVTLLGVGNVIDNMTLGLIASLMTGFSNWASQSTSEKKSCTHFKHHSGVSLPTNSLEKELKQTARDLSMFVDFILPSLSLSLVQKPSDYSGRFDISVTYSMCFAYRALLWFCIVWTVCINRESAQHKGSCVINSFYNQFS